MGHFGAPPQGPPPGPRGQITVGASCKLEKGPKKGHFGPYPGVLALGAISGPWRGGTEQENGGGAKKGHFDPSGALAPGAGLIMNPKCVSMDP